jgi:hypothetical protein
MLFRKNLVAAPRSKVRWEKVWWVGDLENIKFGVSCQVLVCRNKKNTLAIIGDNLGTRCSGINWVASSCIQCTASEVRSRCQNLFMGTRVFLEVYVQPYTCTRCMSVHWSNLGDLAQKVNQIRRILWSRNCPKDDNNGRWDGSFRRSLVYTYVCANGGSSKHDVVMDDGRPRMWATAASGRVSRTSQWSTNLLAASSENAIIVLEKSDFNGSAVNGMRLGSHR